MSRLKPVSIASANAVRATAIAVRATAIAVRATAIAVRASAIALCALVAGCGGSSTGDGGSGPGTSTTSTAVTHANAVSLLPTATAIRAVIRPTSTPTRYDQVLNPNTLNSSFSTSTSQAARTASGTAELGAMGRRGTYLYVHVFVFKKLAAAKSLASAFLASTRLNRTLAPPSDAPGDQRAASAAPYCAHRCLSYRYAFRDQNVLSYVELDGPRGKYSLADAVRVAQMTDGRIRHALG
jgi:hypothetical protein